MLCWPGYLSPQLYRRPPRGVGALSGFCCSGLSHTGRSGWHRSNPGDPTEWTEAHLCGREGRKEGKLCEINIENDFFISKSWLSFSGYSLKCFRLISNTSPFLDNSCHNTFFFDLRKN